jgi:hypothetical protein
MPEERVLRSRVPYEGLVIERNFLARTLVESAPEQGRVFDVIVVGSGMGGGTLADALADAGVNTLLLEAGSLLFPSNVADLPGPNDVFAVKAFENLEGSELTRDVCINFGGRSVFWTGLARSPDRRAVPVFGAVGCSSGWRNAKPLHRTPKRG